MSIKEVTMYQAICDECKNGHESSCGSTCWPDESWAIEQAGYDDWFYDSKINRVLCPGCQKCEVCGESGYEINDHLVCDNHEDHDFAEATA